MRTRAWLLACAALAVAALVVVLAAPDADALRAILGVPLVCAAPGYALMRALGLQLDPQDGRRIVLVPALSLAATIATVLVIALVGAPIDTHATVIGLAGLTIALSLVGLVRARPPVPGGIDLPQPLVWTLTSLVAVAVCAAAIAVLSHPLKNDGLATDVSLSALWADGGHVQVAVDNAQGTSQRYTLELWVAGRKTSSTAIVLGPGRTWHSTLTADPSGRRAQVVEARLYRPGDTRTPYRQVILRA
jgi:uncharacterized membrane protein